MGREEQIEEREVLDSIFPDEITGISASLFIRKHAARPAPLTKLVTADISEHEFRISITIDIPDDEEESPVMVLTVRYPEDYPDKAPHLELAAAPGIAPHTHLNLASDKTQLLEGLQATIEENLGMAMVFTLVSTLKDAAEQLVQDRKEAAATVHEEALLEAEREENKKFHGTPVNRETFLAWRESFMKEMEEVRIREEEEKAAEMKKARIKEPARLTGRQLWERGLAGASAEEEGEEDGLPVDEMRKVKVGDE